ncbi:MAG: hypothetical protein ACOYVD_06205 [Bacillota bacterium]
MSFKAVDLQVMVQRTPDIGKLQQMQLQQGQNENHAASQQLKKEMNIQEKSVNKMDYAINGNINDNQQNKRGKNGNSNKIQKDTQNDEEDKLVPKVLGNILDIHI